MNLLNKISVKNVCGKIDAEKIEKDDMPIMQIIGIATQAKSIPTTYGNATAFKGNFKAKNLLTNKDYVSGKLFLPRIAESLLEGQFIAGDTANEIKFGFIITLRKADNKVGYEYGIQSLIEPTENDPIALLEATLNKKK